MSTLSRSRNVFACPHYNADQERSHTVACVCLFGYSWSSGLAPVRVYFDDVTVFSVHTRKQRFRKASFSNSFTLDRRAFLNGSVFGEFFGRCSVDNSRIRSKRAAFSFENGLVWTGLEKHSRRYLHAGMQASEENNISLRLVIFNITKCPQY